MVNTRIGTIGLLTALLGLLLLPAAGGEVIGRTAVALEANQARTGLAECTLGDVVADAVRAAVPNTDVALVAAAYLKPESIPVGDISRERITGALQFPDEGVVVLELSGSELQAALERSLELLPRPAKSFLQVSGVSVTYRSANAPRARVVEVKVGTAVVLPTRVYRVAMPALLAKGGLGYYRVFTRPPKQVGPSLRDAVVKHVQTAGTVVLPPAPRLRDSSSPAAK